MKSQTLHGSCLRGRSTNDENKAWAWIGTHNDFDSAFGWG